MKDLRLIFSKKGPAAYISHLDLTRMFARMFTRAKVPISYTKGFNPHPYMSFPAPVPLGFLGEREIMNFTADDDIDLREAKNALNIAAPEGIEIIDVYTPADKPSEIAYCLYRICFGEDVIKLAESYFSRKSIIVTKKTKSSDQEIDAAEHIKHVEVKNIDDKTFVEIILPINSENSVNPIILINSFRNFIGTELSYTVARLKMLKADLSEFI